MRLHSRSGAPASTPSFRAGFSLIEILIAMTILSAGLLGIAAMFSTGYTDVASGGKTTMALEAARQTIEDIRLLPAQNQFGNLMTLVGADFVTTNAASLPAANPMQTIARKFRYMLAGGTGAWGITPAMIAQWGDPLQWGDPNVAGVIFGGTGRINVTDFGPTVGAPAGTLAQVTVTVTPPGRPAVVLTTLVSRL
jgi:prepilin-type N-terminal cleavage/methylation domain-containing protein